MPESLPNKATGPLRDLEHGAKICFLDQTGELGGAELCLLDIATHFRNRCQVILFADGPFRRRLEERAIPVKVMAAPGAITGIKRSGGKGAELLAIPSILSFARSVAREMRGFDVVFANTQKAMVVGSLASKFARKPLIWYLHDIITADHFGRVNQLVGAKLAKWFAKRVIANSEASKAALVQSGAEKLPIRVVPNGLDSEPFDSITPTEIEKLRADLQLTSAPVVSVFSRLAPWKGQRVLIEAAATLPDIQFLIVGDALFAGEKEYEASLKSLCAEKGISSRVHFLGFRRDIPELMKLSDIIVHTSTSPEPFGRVIVEGMLAEKPVIATRGGGASEIVDPHQTGILTTPGDPSDLAQAIRDLLQDRERASRIAMQGRAKAIQCYSVAAMVEAIDAEVELACSRK